MQHRFNDRTPEEQRVLRGRAAEYLGLVAGSPGGVRGPYGDPRYAPDGASQLALRGGYRVRLRFSDGVTRTLDRDRWLTGPAHAYVRPERRCVRVRLVNGALAWPNGACFPPDVLRSFPARTPSGWQDEV